MAPPDEKTPRSQIPAQASLFPETVMPQKDLDGGTILFPFKFPYGWGKYVIPFMARQEWDWL